MDTITILYSQTVLLTMNTYVEREPMRILFSNDAFQNTFKNLKEQIKKNRGENIEVNISNEEIETILYDIGFLFNSNEKVCINEHHELFKLMSMPHIEEIIFDQVVSEVLIVHIGKVYAPCLPLDLVSDFVGRDEREVKQAIDVLKRFRLINPSMIMKGTSKSQHAIENASNVINKMDTILSLMDDNDSISVEELQTIIDGNHSSTDEKSNIISMTEEQLHHNIMEGKVNDVKEIAPSNRMTKFDGGTRGTTINKKNDWVREFGKFRTSLLDGMDNIYELN